MRTVIRVIAAAAAAAALCLAGSSAQAAPPDWCLKGGPSVNGTCSG